MDFRSSGNLPNSHLVVMRNFGAGIRGGTDVSVCAYMNDQKLRKITLAITDYTGEDTV